jgi:hypothetical protein
MFILYELPNSQTDKIQYTTTHGKQFLIKSSFNEVDKIRFTNKKKKKSERNDQECKSNIMPIKCKMFMEWCSSAVKIFNHVILNATRVSNQTPTRSIAFSNRQYVFVAKTDFNAIVCVRTFLRVRFRCNVKNRSFSSYRVYEVEPNAAGIRVQLESWRCFVQ